jgi:CheY-like chemotaxis protein
MEADTLETGNYVVVSVEDTGCGIALEDQNRIFEKFGQVGNVLTDKPQGTGLGLTICGTIVVLHGGALWVESSMGKGSCFSFSLPVSTETIDRDTRSRRREETKRAAREAQNILAEAIDRSASGRRILVVDDEPTIVSAISRFLDPMGYDSVGCYSGESALDMARELKPDAILLDIMMPDRNGFDVLRDLKADEETAAIPVIVVSGLDEPETAFELGASEYIRKPFDMASLLENVRALV